MSKYIGLSGGCFGEKGDRNMQEKENAIQKYLDLRAAYAV
jgi:hypothetical protein